MKWSFRFARVFGIDLKIHFTFFIILVFGAVQWQHAGVAGMGFGVLMMVLLFGCVTLHELGHCVVAQRFHVPVKQIILLPIGGVATLGRIPRNPTQELLIALAGPAVNVVIAAGLFLLTLVLSLERPAQYTRGAPSFSLAVYLLLIMNVSLVVFNMLPAFPLDGGRVLRAILAYFMPHVKATRIAATVGQLAAVAFGILALVTGDIMIGLIAVFIFLAAGAESTQTQASAVLATKTVGDAYNKHAITLTVDDRVSRVVDYILTSYQPDFAVISRGKLLGVVTREQVMEYLAANRYDVYVTEIMAEEVPHVDHHLSLDEVRQTMGEQGQRVVAVFDRDEFLGLVSAEDIAEAHAVLSFMQRQSEPPTEAVMGTPSTYGTR